MKTSRHVDENEEVGNHKGRAHLRAVQSQGLTKLQAQLQDKEGAIPRGINKARALRMRRVLSERLGEQLEKVLAAIRSMAESSRPHIRRFYEEVLKKKVFTEENIRRLAEIAKSSWRVMKVLFSWVQEMCEQKPGAVGVVVGGALGFKATGFIAGLLAAIPFVGAKLAGVAALIGIVGGAYYGYKMAMSLHGHWFRKEVIFQPAGMQEQLDEIQTFLAANKFKDA